MAQHRLGPFALARMGTGGSDSFQLLHLRGGQDYRGEFHLPNLLPVYF